MTTPKLPAEHGLDEVVRASLDSARGRWSAIGKDEKSGVTQSWISKFVRRKIPNPGYATLKNLHAYLAANGLMGQPTTPAAKRARRAKH